jgi:GTP-binding protein Era
VGEYVPADLIGRKAPVRQQSRTGAFRVPGNDRLQTLVSDELKGLDSGMSNVTRAGHVALIGLPNAGKSSLLNRLLGSKLSIVTQFAQTTRERVVGIDSRDGVQMIFLDTPGIVDPAYLLHHAMSEAVEVAIRDADVVVLLLDGTRAPPKLAEGVLETLRASKTRVLPVINKIDEARPAAVAALASWAAEEVCAAPMEISATTGAGIEDLRREIAARLPASPFLFPEDELSTQSMRFFVSELIRETIFEQYQEEVPYSTAVRVEEYREEKTPLVIRATIYVERQSQKAIIIGRGGTAIRELGAAARAKIEELVGGHAYLELWVKVLPKWRKDPLELARLGFSIPQQKKQSA